MTILFIFIGLIIGYIIGYSVPTHPTNAQKEAKINKLLGRNQAQIIDTTDPLDIDLGDDSIL